MYACSKLLISDPFSFHPLFVFVCSSQPHPLPFVDVCAFLSYTLKHFGTYHEKTAIF